MKIKIILGLIACLSFNACSFFEHTMSARADMKDMDFFTTEGVGSIQGQAFLRTNGGEVKTGAGLEMVIAPLTPYMQEFYYQFNQKIAVKNFEYKLLNFKKSARMDMNGNFKFDKLSPGTYLLASRIEWLVSANNKSGGFVAKVVDLQEGQNLSFVLSSNEFGNERSLMRLLGVYK